MTYHGLERDMLGQSTNGTAYPSACSFAALQTHVFIHYLVLHSASLRSPYAATDGIP